MGGPELAGAGRSQSAGAQRVHDPAAGAEPRGFNRADRARDDGECGVSAVERGTCAAERAGCVRRDVPRADAGAWGRRDACRPHRAQPYGVPVCRPRAAQRVRVRAAGLRAEHPLVS